MNIHKEARVLLSRCLGFYQCYIKFNDKNLNKFYFKMQKSSCVYPSLIDIHATTQNVQLQYTRNSSRKPTSNKYSRNYADAPYWSAIKMFDAGLGWASDAPMSDSAIYKLENLFTGIQNFDAVANVKSFKIFPNPITSGAALISFTLEKNVGAIISLNDIAGKIISQQTKEGVKGENTLILNFKNVSSGMYILNLKVAKESVNMKVIVN